MSMSLPPCPRKIASETNTFCWDFFDAVYCISLKHRTDRQEQARKEFNKVGLGDKVQFVLVDRHPYDCEQGIFQSHQLCLHKGLASGAEVILIFEDDVVFHGVTPERISNIVHFLRCTRKWNIFFLGGLIDKAQKTNFPSVIKIRYRCSAHAYAVKRDTAARLHSRGWANVPYDSMLRNEADLAAFAAWPGLAFQSDSYSDNTATMGIDRIRRLLGGIRHIQRMNNFYHVHKTKVILAHAALAGLGGLLLFGL
ncbi:MAG: hypothetical protein R6V55_04195 [Desulfovermiculus sp.]